MGCFKVASIEKSAKAELMVTSKMYANFVELNPSEKIAARTGPSSLYKYKMDGVIANAAVETATRAAMDLSLSGAGFSISLKIDNPWLAGAVSLGALSLGAFYLVCKGPAEGAIKRALERTLFSDVDPEVTNITDGHSILVELQCHSEMSLLLFLEDYESKTIKFRLEKEFKKIGFNDQLEVVIQNEELVNKEATEIRERHATQRKTLSLENWHERYEELADMINKLFEMQVHVPQQTGRPKNPRTREPLHQLQELEKVLKESRLANDLQESDSDGFQKSNVILEELSSVKETLKREMTISKGLRRTIEKLQEENRRLEKSSEPANVHGTNDGKDESLQLKSLTREKTDEIKALESYLLELREKVHELEKENESLQQKLKKKEKELGRFQGDVTDDVEPPSRPRTSSGISLGASSGYQSEEEPDESSLEIIQMPQSQAVQEGKTLVLSCRTRGLPDIRYRWVKDDIEIPGANRSDLVLSSVRMEDFGRYFCRVWDKSGSVTSDIAEVDVFPASGMRFRGLHETNMETKQAIIDLLNKKRLPGLASWKQVARRYGMREKEISFLESAKNPAGAMLESLASLSPNITVYFICKTFKESGLRRMDVVNVLSRHVVTPMKSTR